MGDMGIWKLIWRNSVQQKNELRSLPAPHSQGCSCLPDSWDPSALVEAASCRCLALVAGVLAFLLLFSRGEVGVALDRERPHLAMGSQFSANGSLDVLAPREQGWIDSSLLMPLPENLVAVVRGRERGVGVGTSPSLADVGAFRSGPQARAACRLDLRIRSKGGGSRVSASGSPAIRS